MIAEHAPLAPLETTKSTFDAVGGPTELKIFKTDKHQIMLFHTEEYSYQDTLDLIIRAEQLGFDSVWLGEEHFYTIGICPSPQIFLTAVARETSRIRLGTSN